MPCCSPLPQSELFNRLYSLLMDQLNLFNLDVLRVFCKCASESKCPSRDIANTGYDYI